MVGHEFEVFNVLPLLTIVNHESLVVIAVFRLENRIGVVAGDCIALTLCGVALVTSGTDICKPGKKSSR
jgi:hypothetical protein